MTVIEHDAPPLRPVRTRASDPPAHGAKRAKLPLRQAPQLAATSDEPPEGEGWISEIKFDGYRLLCWNDHGKVHVVTRSGLDWTDRLPALARAVGALNVTAALIDGELVALGETGVSSFPALQAALSAGKDETLNFFAFDLPYLDGWDLRPCRLIDRKRVLSNLADRGGMLRFSHHYPGDAALVHREACRAGLEGIVCKQADAPYRAGRGRDWLKVKCHDRQEFVVLGWTPPEGHRTGLGALHLGYYDARGRLHYAGGAGTGFSEYELAHLSGRLALLGSDPPKSLELSGDPLPNDIRWVKPRLVAEVRFASWSGSGRVRQAVYLGLREDKPASEVVRDPADPGAERTSIEPRRSSTGAERGSVVAVPPRRTERQYSSASDGGGNIVTARAPARRGVTVGGVTLTHPDRELWPGITKRDLAEYWNAIADYALGGLARRPLSVVRCPEGIGGQHFFQKQGHGALPEAIREGKAGGQPYLSIDGADGLIAMAQVSAIELHVWGATEADPLHPDQIVFDLDPGEGVVFADVVGAAIDVRDRLHRLRLESFCRTTGGKGLHVVVPLEPRARWDEVKAFCRTFAETLSQEQPERFLSTVKKVDRRGKILIDWLRNSIGATAVASYCPRARPGANVATPLPWDAINRKLDPAKFTVQSIPDRLARQHSDPWQGFDAARRHLAGLVGKPLAAPGNGRSVIVTATKPKRRS